MKYSFINNDFIRSEEAALHYTDLAIQRGYGIFDFLKTLNGRPLFIEEHLRRFSHSAEQMHLDISHSKEELKEIIHLLIKKNEVDECGIRITLTGGYSPDGYKVVKPNLVITAHHFKTPSNEEFSKGIRLMTHGFQRQLPQVKTIDYLMAIWLQPRLAEKKADDVLYFNNGIITECPRANFFIVTADDHLVTPAENILMGITRMKILETAMQRMPVEIRPVELKELAHVKEAFICSTTKMILPVRQIDQHILPGKNPTAELLQSLLQQSAAAYTIPLA